jgi:hypothetical protein
MQCHLFSLTALALVLLTAYSFSDDQLALRRNALGFASQDGSRLGSPKINDARDLYMGGIHFESGGLDLPPMLEGDKLPTSVRFFSSRECACGQARVEIVLNENTPHSSGGAAYRWEDVPDLIDLNDETGLIGSVYMVLRAEALAYLGKRDVFLDFCQPDPLNVAEGMYDGDVCRNITVGADSGKPMGDMRGGVLFNHTLPNGVHRIRAFLSTSSRVGELLPIGAAVYVYVGEEEANYKFSRVALKFQSNFYSQSLQGELKGTGA